MLAEARAQMAAASSAMAATAVVPPTGPHMLSFADRVNISQLRDASKIDRQLLQPNGAHAHPLHLCVTAACLSGPAWHKLLMQLSRVAGC